MRAYLVLVVFLVFTGLILCGCRTVYGPAKRRLPGEKIQKDRVIEKPLAKKDDSLRSQNYRYISTLPKLKLDQIMAAMEQYHLQMFDAIRPKWKELPKYVNIIITEDEDAFSRMIGNTENAIIDSDHAAVVPSKRKIVVLYSDKWKDFSRRLFRSQARMFFSDAMPSLPAWLSEGMISFFQEVAIGGIGGETKFKIVGYNAQKMAKLQEHIKNDDLPGLAAVISVTEREKLSDRDKLAAWAFFYWSQHSGRGSQQAFKNYIKALKDNGPDTDIEKHLQMPLNEFEKQWKKWLLKQEIYLDKGKQELDIERKK